MCSCICETPKHSVPQRQEVMCVIGLATRRISQSDSPLLSGIITETLGVETARSYVTLTLANGPWS